MKQKYINHKIAFKGLQLVKVIDSIATEYMQQGYTLTVRQLYYQLVARDVIPNTERSYKNTVNLCNNARLAGLIDWDAIEDRTRAFVARSSWRNGSEILQSAAKSYHQDMWATQTDRVFVIVEKEALAGVLERVCHKYDVPLLAARGYASVSVLREFAITRLSGSKQQITLLHLGDHDPSGIDMTRDLRDRLEIFVPGINWNLRRIALTMDQIEEQQPPPNPAKVTDSRFEAYAAEYGDESWELDALQPSYLHGLVEQYIVSYIDQKAWKKVELEIKAVKQKIQVIANDF